MWRLSKTGELAKISDHLQNCVVVGGYSDFIYFTDVNGLWVSNGSPGDKRLLRSANSLHQGHILDGICELESDLYLAYVSNDPSKSVKRNLIKIVNQTEVFDVSREVFAANSKLDLRIEGCVGNGIGFSYANPDPEAGRRGRSLWFYDRSSRTSYRLAFVDYSFRPPHNVSGSASTREGDNKMLVDWHGMPFYLSLLDTSFLSVISDLILENDQVSDNAE